MFVIHVSRIVIVRAGGHVRTFVRDGVILTNLFHSRPSTFCSVGPTIALLALQVPSLCGCVCV